ncbi:anthocyanidin 3-O-glucosyltransferase UFGT [Gossypium hirsutum]|uniref:Glycosyltransferase n=1 Tax=Gossypium hirsutum TaxID=3635 RepID=A0ABM3BSP3_GOSHI|nr:anthocyanidin 3-O-glucosyltransferase UFGT-like [Gossypium hirsutum]
MSATQSLKEKHVAVLAFPFGSHDLTILGLACKLARAAPNVQFSFFTIPKSNHSKFSTFKFNVPNNIRTYDVEDGVPVNHVFSGNPVERLDLFLKATLGNFQKGLDVAVMETGRKVNCFVTDMFLTFAADMAEDMKATWIPLCVSIPHNLSAHVYTDLIRRLFSHVGGDKNGGQHQTLELIPGLSPMHVKDLSDEILPRHSNETFFSDTLCKIGCVLPRSTAIVMNFCQELYPTPLFDDLKSIFGTAAAPPGEELEALAEAIEESDIPFIWSLNNDHKHHLPNGFLQRTNKRGKLVPWAPQAMVLGHASAGVFVTHCGANSVFESIANGVPMVCRPMFGDHWMIGRVVEEIWGVGVKVEGLVFTKSGVLESLKLVLGHEQGRQMRERIKALRELVLKAVAPSGSASQDFKTLVETILNS